VVYCFFFDDIFMKKQHQFTHDFFSSFPSFSIPEFLAHSLIVHFSAVFHRLHVCQIHTSFLVFRSLDISASRFSSYFVHLFIGLLDFRRGYIKRCIFPIIGVFFLEFREVFFLETFPLIFLSFELFLSMFHDQIFVHFLIIICFRFF